MNGGDEGADDEPVEQFERGLDLDRVVMFSDAVFAIAMTVLTVSLRLPANTTNAQVPHAIHEAIPSILAYFLSFAVSGTYWLAHHRYFRHMSRIDTRMLILNFVVLAFVAFLPFPTQVLGEHGSTRAAAIFYAGSVALLGTAVSAAWAYASHNGRLLRPDTTRSYVQYTLLRSVSVTAVFALSIPVALISPQAAEWSWLLLLVCHAALARVYGRMSDR